MCMLLVSVSSFHLLVSTENDNQLPHSITRNSKLNITQSGLSSTNGPISTWTTLFTDLLNNLPSQLLSLIAIGISLVSFCCMTLLLVGCILSSCRSRRKSSHVQDEALRAATLQRPLGDAVRDKFQLTVIENPSLQEAPPVPCDEHKNLPMNGGRNNSVQ